MRDVGPDERGKLFEQARELSRRQATWAEADRMWGRVIDAYRRAVDGPGQPDRRDQQQLARALWRHGMLLSARGRAGQGMAPGGEAVAIFERVYDAVAAEGGNVAAPPRDDALAELITALVDLAEVAFAAGQPATRRELLDRAVAVGLTAVGAPPSAGPRTREAMGAAYHNQATALLHRHLTRPSSVDGVREATLAASRACELRQALLDPARPLSLWEMANTYGVYARCLAMIGDTDRAAVVLALGNRLVELLGPAAEQPAQNLRVAAELLGREEATAGSRRFRWRRR
ncbi:hypothetical protein F8271_12520 [Micromonospora sp. ALFpr18c]|uniref:hypothetical protein n=1 Tax=unclassified Micromonospora TaxID=2617518 RepID=UPI00124B350E|nr:hypothetical protein [Micromonospora sp. ALFpr18c]KAB1942399.1 hypothetical protein F8271_12520 [Micromonospora sp. ALFpr18c]